MANLETEIVIKVNVDDEVYASIKRNIKEDIARAVEQAYKEGYADASPDHTSLEVIEHKWEVSDIKKRIDELIG